MCCQIMSQNFVFSQWSIFVRGMSLNATSKFDATKKTLNETCKFLRPQQTHTSILTPVANFEIIIIILLKFVQKAIRSLKNRFKFSKISTQIRIFCKKKTGSSYTRLIDQGMAKEHFKHIPPAGVDEKLKKKIGPKIDEISIKTRTIAPNFIIFQNNLFKNLGFSRDG